MSKFNAALFDLGSSQISIGIDIVEVERFNNIWNKKSFLKKIFTEKELKDCNKKISPGQSLAARFAVKEAVRKTIKDSVRFNQIETSNKKDGSPEVSFLNKKISQKYKAIISITHTKNIAQAICLTFKI